MNATSTEQFPSEPTVVGAVSRYRAMVVVIALLVAAVSVGYTLVTPERFTASATVAVPPPPLSMELESAQHLDGQVVLMRSEEVASRATRIANGTLRSDVLGVRDFSGRDQSLMLLPPEGSQTGDFGSSIVTVSFTWATPEVAEVGANAFVQAYDEVRSAAIATESQATVAGIEKAISDARTQAQRGDLEEQRTEALVSRQIAIARRPAVDWAVQPEFPINGNSKRAGAIGLVVGALLGAAVAFLRAGRRRCFDDRLEPAAVYDTPLLGEIPAAPGDVGTANGAPDAEALLPVLADPGSDVAEGFRIAAGSLERVRATSGGRLSVTFVSTEAGVDTSAVVANTALAIADSGTPVLVVDANPTNGRVTSLLLPESGRHDGQRQVLLGQGTGTGSFRPSSLHHRVTVLPAGPSTRERVNGVQTRFDVVLIDGPAMLGLVEATELVHATHVTVVVVGSEDPVHAHLELAHRLRLIGAELVGYIYRHEPAQRRFGRLRRRLSRRPRAVSDRGLRGWAAPASGSVDPARVMDGDPYASSPARR